MDDLPRRDVTLQGVGEANEFQVAMALHVAGEDRAGQDVQGGEQRRGSVALCASAHPHFAQSEPTGYVQRCWAYRQGRRSSIRLILWSALRPK